MTLLIHYFKEHSLLTAVILVGATFLLAGIKFSQLAIEYAFDGLTAKEIFDLFLILIPGFLDFTMPLAVILGSAAFCQKLALDREITAFKSLGYSIHIALAPIVLTSLLVAGCHFLALSYLRPISQSVLEAELAKLVINKTTSILPVSVPVELGKLKVFVSNREGDNLKDIFLTVPSERLEIFFATEGKLDYLLSQQGLVLSLRNGWNLSFKGFSLEGFSNFEANEFFESVALKGVQTARKSSQLSNTEILENIAYAKAAINDFEKLKSDENHIAAVKERLVLQEVSEHTLWQKLKTLKKELSRRFLSPVYDVVFAALAGILALNLAPKIGQYYFVTAYAVIILTFVTSLFLIDAISEKLNYPDLKLSEGFITILAVLLLIFVRGFWRLKLQRRSNGLAAVFGR